MRDLIEQLNWQGIKVDISTFSKASKKRSPEVFEELFNKLNQDLRKKKGSHQLALFPLDSTTIILTSKLFWQANIHQLKLFYGCNSLTSEVGGVLLHFGQGHSG